MQSEEQNRFPSQHFRICESCGRLTPSNSPQCAECGAFSAQAVAAAHQAGEERRFLNDLFTRPAPVTPIIIGVNIAIYLLITIAAGGNFLQALISGADRFTLLAFGAQTNELLRNGEWFRLITPAFVHIGLLHLGMNSYVLWTIGPLVEKLYGSSRYLLIYLLCAAGGSYASFLNHSMKNDPVGASAGASGAIFGLFGVVAVFSYRYRNELPANFLRALKSGVLPAIVINLLIGFSIKFVDNAAHIGGLLTGAVLALVITYIPTRNRRRVSPLGLIILALCVGVILTCFFLAYRHSSPLLNRRASKVEALLNNFAEADQAMVIVFRAAGESASWKPTQKNIAQLSAASNALERSVTPDAQTEQIRLGFLRLLQQQREVLNREVGMPESGQSLDDRLQPIGADFLKLQRAYRDWLKKEGPIYGFSLRESPNQTNDSNEAPSK